MARRCRCAMDFRSKRADVRCFRHVRSDVRRFSYALRSSRAIGIGGLSHIGFHVPSQVVAGAAGADVRRLGMRQPRWPAICMARSLGARLLSSVSIPFPYTACRRNSRGRATSTALLRCLPKGDVCERVRAEKGECGVCVRRSPPSFSPVSSLCRGLLAGRFRAVVSAAVSTRRSRACLSALSRLRFCGSRYLPARVLSSGCSIAVAPPSAGASPRILSPSRSSPSCFAGGGLCDLAPSRPSTRGRRSVRHVASDHAGRAAQRASALCAAHSCCSAGSFRIDWLFLR